MDWLFKNASHHRIESAEEAATRAGNRMSEAEMQMRQMDRRIDRLSMICRAMWELVQEQTDLTEDDLAKRVEEIDLRDGERDGALKQPAAKCGQCDRTLRRGEVICHYCGSVNEPDSAFDQI